MVNLPKTSKHSSKDELDELIEGDTVWYKNSHPNVPAKWIKATFLKKFSLNTLQVSVGSAAIMAHRSQIKPYFGREEVRPNVMMAPNSSGSNNEAGGGDDEMEFRGFPECELVKTKRRKRDASRANLPPICPRRSKRIRKRAFDADFDYEN